MRAFQKRFIGKRYILLGIRKYPTVTRTNVHGMRKGFVKDRKLERERRLQMGEFPGFSVR